jgi:hypothetical protein
MRALACSLAALALAVRFRAAAPHDPRSLSGGPRAGAAAGRGRIGAGLRIRAGRAGVRPQRSGLHCGPHHRALGRHLPRARAVHIAARAPLLTARVVQRVRRHALPVHEQPGHLWRGLRGAARHGRVLPRRRTAHGRLEHHGQCVNAGARRRACSRAARARHARCTSRRCGRDRAGRSRQVLYAHAGMRRAYARANAPLRSGSAAEAACVRARACRQLHAVPGLLLRPQYRVSRRRLQRAYPRDGSASVAAHRAAQISVVATCEIHIAFRTPLGCGSAAPSSAGELSGGWVFVIMCAPPGLPALPTRSSRAARSACSSCRLST